MNTLPCGLYPGDFIFLDAPSDAGRLAVVVGERPSGALRVRRCRPFDRLRDHIKDYRGAWRLVAITDAEHPLFELPELEEAV